MQSYSAAFALVLGLVSAAAADWPAHRADSSRSGYTAEPLPTELAPRWCLRFAVPPYPAWPTSQRMDDDLAFQPIVVGDLVLVASGVEGMLLAIDANSGAPRWRFFCSSPLRFAPVAWKDRVFVAGDDGQLHALALKDGSRLWSHRGAQGPEWVLGNEHLISHWPARGGPVVHNGVVYYTAGIWPSDGVSVHAVDALSGQVRWCNTESGALFMAQPHGGAEAQSGVAPQGYLAAGDGLLVVPTGRAVPAVFNLSDGSLRYYHLAKNQQRGGVRVAMGPGGFFNAGCFFEAQAGELKATLGAGALVATSEGLLRAEGRSLQVHRAVKVKRHDRKGREFEALEWQLSSTVQLPGEALEAIVAGEDAVIGMNNEVCAVDYRGQKTVWWKQAVEGRALGLAASGGRLVVSTDRGVLYLFDSAPAGSKMQEHRLGQNLPHHSAQSLEFSAAMLRGAPRDGYGLLVGSSELSLVTAMTAGNRLNWVVLVADEARAHLMREALADAGLLGSRVAVLLGDAAASFLPRSFANVIAVASAGLMKQPGVADEMRRLLRPYTGWLCQLNESSQWTHERAQPLKGAGQWTHQNGNAANTLCSDDALVQGKLSMHWFRDVEFEIANRHGQGPAPLVAQGVMVVGGVHGVCAVDAFNGRLMWKHEVPNWLADYDGIHHDVGIGDTGGPMCLGQDSVFLRTGEQALRISLQTGEVLARWSTPVEVSAKDRRWGFIAHENGLVIGSVENSAHRVSPRYQHSQLRTESVLLFALDAKTGVLKWKYQPKGSIRHNAIAIAAGRVFLVDRPLVKEDLVLQARRNGVAAARMSANALPAGELMALDVASGRLLWSQKEDVWGTQLSASAAHGVLLMNYKAVRHNFFELPSEAGGRLAAFDLNTGKRRWDQVAEYQTRPLINDRSIYAQGGAWDLLSGSPLNFELKRSYGCGQISGSRHLMLFRSATLGYVDLSRQAGTENYGGIRPSCWINAIPAEGMVLVPDGSSKCQCSYQMKAWFALQGRR